MKRPYRAPLRMYVWQMELPLVGGFCRVWSMP